MAKKTKPAKKAETKPEITAKPETKISKIIKYFENGAVDMNAIALATNANISTVRTQHSKWKKANKKE